LTSVTNAVRQRPEDQCPEHQPEQAGREHRTQRALGQAPFLGESRRHIADRLGIETVEKQYCRAGQQQPDLESADRLLFDEIGDIDRRCGALCLRNGHRHPLPLNVRPQLLSTRLVDAA
jgi:hypothetical protein